MMKKDIIKKAVTLPASLVLTLSLLTGCGESTPMLDAADYELDAETNKTDRGVSINDTPETFLAAYGEYRIFTSVDGGDYQMLPNDEIPFDSAITTLLPTFFVDGTPIDPDVFCKENEIDKTDLLSFLCTEDYLRSHTVVYYYLTFTWENGVIADITSSYMDYNEDASYYESFSG